MKKLYLLLLILFVSFKGISQDKEPLFSFLSTIKNTSEYQIKKDLIRQELVINTLSDVPKGNKNKEERRLQNFDNNVACMDAYMKVKQSTDKLITQIKSDLVISNRKRLLKELNGDKVTPTRKWYDDTIEQIQKDYAILTTCKGEQQLAVGIAPIALTELFASLVGIVTSARDFRALKIKELNTQLDELRMKDYSEITAGGSKSTSEKESEKSENL